MQAAAEGGLTGYLQDPCKLPAQPDTHSLRSGAAIALGPGELHNQMSLPES